MQQKKDFTNLTTWQLEKNKVLMQFNGERKYIFESISKIGIFGVLKAKIMQFSNLNVS